MQETQETQVWFLGWEYPLGKEMTITQCSCLGKPRDRGVGQATVHGVIKGRTRQATEHEGHSDCSTPGSSVVHGLPECAQVRVHWVSDVIWPSHPLPLPSPPALNLSQHQGFSQWVSSSQQVAKVCEFQLQHQSFQWTPRTDLLWDGLVGSPCSPRDSQESSPTPQFKSINFSALSFLHSPTLTSIHDHWKNQSFDQADLCWQSNVSAF